MVVRPTTMRKLITPPRPLSVTVWEKISKGRAGISWDNAAEKIWKDLGDQEKILSIDKVGGYKAEM